MKGRKEGKEKTRRAKIFKNKFIIIIKANGARPPPPNKID